MDKRSAVIGFLSGFFLAIIIGFALVIPMSRDAWQMNVDSDVFRGIQGALENVEQSAADGNHEKAAAQLKQFNSYFAKYRDGGPPPAQWWGKVVATTQASNR